jgi:hypothetical protein
MCLLRCLLEQWCCRHVHLAGAVKVFFHSVKYQLTHVHLKIRAALYRGHYVHMNTCMPASGHVMGQQTICGLHLPELQLLLLLTTTNLCTYHMYLTTCSFCYELQLMFECAASSWLCGPQRTVQPRTSGGSRRGSANARSKRVRDRTWGL